MGIFQNNTSGYAWFTMSREVEVKNIQMTATVPEDIQLSLGEIVGHSKDVNLATGTGVLKTTSKDVVSAPTADYDWSNTADISAYYAFGKLIPASSYNGQNVFFTPDANGVGKTVDPNGNFYVAASGAAATAESTYGSGANTAKATSHVYTDASAKNFNSWSGTYAKSVGWNDTNDDGYYIDIPVWLRTSSKEGINIGVKAYVKDVAAADAYENLTNADTAASGTGEMLYRAVRVAVLKEDSTQITGLDPTTLVAPLAVQDGDSGTAPYDPYATGSIVNYYTRSAVTSGTGQTNENNGGAVSAIGTGIATSVTYSQVNAEDGTTVIGKLTSDAPGDYGDATKYIIRVWLEGEDPDCWNETAGQDWSINLKFVKL